MINQHEFSLLSSLGFALHCSVAVLCCRLLTSLSFCAGASASAAACGDEVLSYASVTATATAIAEALAIATAQSYVSCHTDEGGYACGDASAYATDTAKAVAKVRNIVLRCCLTFADY